MPWNDSDELVVAGSGQVYVAPVGTTLPTTPTGSLNSAFAGLGFHTEDGASFSAEPTIQEFGAWQARQPIRREMTGQDATVSFVLQQWNEVTVPLAFGGGTISSVSGGYRYDPPEDTADLAEKAMVVELVDGSDTHRIVVPRGSVTDAVESQFQRSSPAFLPITFKVLEPTEGGVPWYYLTTAAGFATGS